MPLFPFCSYKSIAELLSKCKGSAAAAVPFDLCGRLQTARKENVSAGKPGAPPTSNIRTVPQWR
jgi:hypothetical protein